MTPILFPSRTQLTLIVLLATFIHFPALRSQETQPYNTCSQSVKCGDIEFEYPFWGFGRPYYCGHPSFGLTCQSNIPVINLESVNYRVLDTDSSTHIITIARNDLRGSICPRNFQNTSFDSTLFNGNNFDQENVTLFYGCRDNMPLPGGLPLVNNYQFSCDEINDTRINNYFYRSSFNVSSFGGVKLAQCNDSITVPVNRSTVTASVSDLRSALNDGFKLEWEANNEDCDRCIRSGGRCGSNSTSPELFVCYCANGNFSSTCNNSNDTAVGAVGGAVGVKKKLIIGFVSSGIALIGLMLMFWIYRKRVTRQGTEIANHHMEKFIRNYGILAPKTYKYSEIQEITNSFEEKLGQGGFGSVYKGQLPDGRLVAVKVLSEATKYGEDFINEVLGFFNGCLVMWTITMIRVVGLCGVEPLI